MLTASQFRKRLRQKYPDWSHNAIASELGLSAGFVGMVLSGAREPSKAVLMALGMERVSFYRPVDGKVGRRKAAGGMGGHRKATHERKANAR